MAELQLVVFQLKVPGAPAWEFGVGINQVHEIIRYSNPTQLPQTPDFIEGIINLRGKVIPLIDLRKRFNLETSPLTDETRIVVVEIGGCQLGIIVDTVSEVLRIPESSIEPPPPVIAGITQDYLKGIGKVDERLLILIDIEKVLTGQEKKELIEMQ